MQFRNLVDINVLVKYLILKLTQVSGSESRCSLLLSVSSKYCQTDYSEANYNVTVFIDKIRFNVAWGSVFDL